MGVTKRLIIGIPQSGQIFALIVLIFFMWFYIGAVNLVLSESNFNIFIILTIILLTFLLAQIIIFLVGHKIIVNNNFIQLHIWNHSLKFWDGNFITNDFRIPTFTRYKIEINEISEIHIQYSGLFLKKETFSQFDEKTKKKLKLKNRANKNHIPLLVLKTFDGEYYFLDIQFYSKKSLSELIEHLCNVNQNIDYSILRK